MTFDPLPEDVAAALAQSRSDLGAFGAVRYVSDVDSTNDVALTLAAAGAAEGVSVLADAQRRGRGRRGSEWFSPPGSGVYLSVVLQPDGPGTMAPVLTLGAGVAMGEAVRTVTGLPVELKWPNDLVIGRPWRKLGGVLTESVSAGNRPVACVVGMGINVRQAALPAELRTRASSVETELGRDVDRAAMVVEVLARLRDVVGRLREEGAAGVLDRWRALARAGLGRHVCWRDSEGDHRGRATDVAISGALVVETARGIREVLAGEVHWEPSRGE